MSVAGNDEAKRALLRLIDITRDVERTEMRLAMLGPRDREMLCRWMLDVIRATADDRGRCCASRIASLRDLADGAAAGLRFKSLRTDLTDELERRRAIQSLDPRRMCVQLVAPTSEGP